VTIRGRQRHDSDASDIGVATSRIPYQNDDPHCRAWRVRGDFAKAASEAAGSPISASQSSCAFGQSNVVVLVEDDARRRASCRQIEVNVATSLPEGSRTGPELIARVPESST
jgi:hypothetical protein